MSVDLARLAADVVEHLQALPRAKRQGGEMTFACPLGDRHRNGDAHPSASYSLERRAWRCKGCGASGGLVKGSDPLAQLLGIDTEPYRVNGAEARHAGRPDRTWEIRDAHGELIALHHRRDLPHGGKRVWWATPDGRLGLGGRKTAELPLYGVERLGQREPGDDAPVVVCEGEPATDALLALGLRAVGSVTGAAGAPCAASLEVLRGEDVVLWPDADEPGRAHMGMLAALLDGVAASVRIFEPGDVPAKGDAADWVADREGVENLATLLLSEIEAHARNAKPAEPAFEALEADRGYRLTVPALAATLELDFLRRERHQLRGELLVRCELPGASTFDGVLTVTEINLSSARSRKELAGHLAERARTEADLWRDPVEELAQRALAAERQGEPDVALAEVQAEPAKILDVEGLRLPREHPAILFGDGDTGKSMILLYVLGRLAQDGLRVGLADWELGPEDHADRLRRLFAGSPPPIRYLRCARPIIHESDRLRRWVREQRLDYVALDSVAYASAGAPESAEVAMAYFQVVRQLGPVGSLHVAHVTKAQEGADRRPFGSTFWHNSARATWYAKLAERDPGGTVSRLGLYPRKWNLGPLPASVGLELAFGVDRTTVRRVDLADTPDLAAHLSVKQRMAAALRTGPLSPAELAEEVGTKPNTVRVTARRHPEHFRLGGGVVSLLERLR